MDFTEFIRLKGTLEPGLKAGLYCVMQSHIPLEYQHFRCGLAGKPVDSATQFKSEEGNFSSRFAQYLNYWGPTNAKVFAVLTVPRNAIMGFAERVMPPVAEGDNREAHARMHLGTTLIQIREQQYHAKLVQLGASRWRMPTTEIGKERSEFFKTDISTCIRALRSIGTGDLFTFHGNNPSQIKKESLKKRGLAPIEPEHVALRKSSRLNPITGEDDNADDGDDPLHVPLTLHVTGSKKVVDALSSGDSSMAKSLNSLGSVRRKSARVDGLNPPTDIEMSAVDLERFRSGSPRMLRTMNALKQLRKS